MGDEYEKSVKNLKAMFDTYDKEDEFDWGNTYRAPSKEFSHGSSLATETANDPRAGASGTYQFVVATEVAHWPDTGVRSAAKTLAAILSCVPNRPNTVIIIDSTPNGASGAFYDTYQGAVTFEDFKNGHRGNGYVRIFFPWHRAEDYLCELTTSEKDEVRRTLTQVEQEMIEKFGIDEERIEFRRRTIASPAFNGDEKLFDQEFVPDDVNCFMSSGRKKFDMAAVTAMIKRAEKIEPMTGILEGAFGGMVFRRVTRGEGDAWMWIWEMPKDGCKYLVSADPMTGVSQTGGKNPDCHAVLVLRAGYYDLTGKYIIPRLVARVFPECRVDLDLLADFCLKVCCYYGNCKFVPEANNSGIALIEALKNEPSMDIYRREQFNLRESKMTEMLGWQTKDGAGREGTRSICLANLSADIRQQNIDIPCLHTLAECQTFIVDDTGKAVASSGKHDDDVLALSIGITTIEGATTYRVQQRARQLPPDLQALVNAQRSQTRSRFT